ncbi:AraC family transcriptional regulator [Paenibacillus sp. FSL H8-0548]|uniref:helix-turn-helix domain-containing protein n=1 Tax=Paenibacillus sp. FSL H8-0548 TaxID=1920422 RepID=UPI0015C3B91A|nr:AraC family transcriptional regulator [Paenibacillus sp. FSL H8-0548]
MNANLTPERLMNENYLTLSSPFRIFQHTITRDIDTHWHEFFEIAFVVSGTGMHLLNGEQMSLRRGMMFLLTPADFHKIIPDPDETICLYDLIFEERFIRYEVLQMIFRSETQYMHIFPDELSSQIDRECNRIWEESVQTDFGAEIVIQGALERMIIELIRACSKRSSAGDILRNDSMQMHPSIQRALVYMHHHFREQLTLHEVAAHAGLSDNYFSECFHQQTGVSYQIYLQKLRLQLASSLLRSTHLTVTEICHASGFNTVPHFERAFKQRYACTPSAYRRDISHLYKVE